MASKLTHIRAAKADGLSDKLAEAAVHVIDPPKAFFEYAYQRELFEVMSWLQPQNLERRMMNYVTRKEIFACQNIDPSKLRLHLLHHILLDLVAYYAIPYKSKLWYELWLPFFRREAEERGFRGIYELAKTYYRKRVSYEPGGEIISYGTDEQDVEYLETFAEILNVCDTFLDYCYKCIIESEEFRYELHKWGYWALKILRERYEIDGGLFESLLKY
jgi:hypothetical protein